MINNNNNQINCPRCLESNLTFFTDEATEEECYFCEDCEYIAKKWEFD